MMRAGEITEKMKTFNRAAGMTQAEVDAYAQILGVSVTGLLVLQDGTEVTEAEFRKTHGLPPKTKDAR